MIKIKLEDVIEYLEFANEFNKSFLNIRTGKIHSIPEEVELYAEMNNDEVDFLPEWEKELLPIAKDIQSNPDNYLEFPDKYEIHEYSIMEKFTFSLTDEKLRDTIYFSLKGSGAFRRFKDIIHRFEIAEQWYKYKEEAIKEIAIEWCKNNNLDYY